MSKEEVRLLKADVKKRKTEIFNFYLVNSDFYETLFKIYIFICSFIFIF